jgi:hypothetical protein
MFVASRGHLITMTAPSTLDWTLRRLAHIALVVAGGMTMSQSLGAQRPEPQDTTGRVIVSRNEVRVYFPPQLARARASSVTPRAGGELTTFLWLAQLDGPTTIGLRFRGGFAAESPPSLLSIVRAGRAALCRYNTENSECSSADVAATLENDRIVVSYRDTVEIRQSFGLHPASIRLLVDIPPEMGDLGVFDAAVHYVDPPILLDSAERAIIASERRRREASVNSYSRRIDGGSQGRTLSLVVGDSVDLWVQEYHCGIHLCGTHENMDRGLRDWGRWSLSDTAVAALHRSDHLVEAAGYPPQDRDRARKLVARRPGRTILRVSGVHTAADTMPSRTPLDTIVEREVIVTSPVSRP